MSLEQVLKSFRLIFVVYILFGSFAHAKNTEDDLSQNDLSHDLSVSRRILKFAESVPNLPIFTPDGKELTQSITSKAAQQVDSSSLVTTEVYSQVGNSRLNDLSQGRKKGNNAYLWIVGIAIAVTAAAAFGVFIKIIWSVSMLSSLLSAASIIMSVLFSGDNAHAQAYRRTVSAAYTAPMDQYYALANKRTDNNHSLKMVNNMMAYDFTTEYSNHV